MTVQNPLTDWNKGAYMELKYCIWVLGRCVWSSGHWWVTDKEKERNKYVCEKFQLFMFLRRQLQFNLMASHLLSFTLGGGLAGLEKRVSFSRKPLCDTEKGQLHNSS